MIEKEHIQQLLERYMASETTIEEERTLKAYFSSHDDFPSAWTAYAVMFQGMNRRVSTAKTKKRSATLKWTVGVAASLLIASLALWMLHDTDNMTTREPEIAKLEQHKPFASEDAPAKTDNEAEEKPATPMPKPKPMPMPKPTPKAAVESAPVQTEREEAVELTDEQLMAEYIAVNFMTLEENRMLEAMRADDAQQEDGEVEINECLNGIGIMIGNDGL